MKAEDLNSAELIEFQPGRVSLQGRRLIVHDLYALGQFRSDLIAMVGDEQARRILTRKGVFWGQADAAAMQRLYQWHSTAEWLKAGAVLARMQGLCDAELDVQTLDLASGRAVVELRFANSVEVDQHASVIGKAAAPCCWVLMGYFTGYASYVLGREVYFQESECQGDGGAICHAEGRDIDSWNGALGDCVQYFEAEDVEHKIKELSAQIKRQQAELANQRRQLAALPIAHGLLPVEAHSPQFRKTLELGTRVAKFDTTVLITGETGCGKEILARYIHQQSLRADKPFLAVNCSALPETLLESELFGHRAGAFTGANQNREGLFETANGGTLFLDEIGDITPAMQVKLLRVLQEREIRRVGESRTRTVDVRVVSATHQHLERMVAEGRFREDLFYRLHVVHIEVPPLRERREDILPLARYFLQRAAERHKVPELRLSPASVEALLEHHWPGNVRELENVLEHAAVMCPGGAIAPEHLPLNRQANAGAAKKNGANPRRPLEEVEFEHIHRVLAETGGNRTEAARVLRIGEATLYRKLKAAREGK